MSNDGELGAAGVTDALAINAFGHLAAERIVGVIWVSNALVIERRFGDLCTPFRPGDGLLDVLPVFQGLECDFASLAAGRVQRLALPNVSVNTGPAKLPKSTVYVFAANPGFVIYVFHAQAEADLERELSRQVKARRIAEQDLREAQRELVRNAEQIREQNRELTAINDELEEFCSIISHDLSTPLRAIRHLCRSTVGDGSIEAPASETVLRSIRDRSEYMSRMIRDLIDYATIGRKAEIAEDIETREIIERLAAQLVPPDHFTTTLTGTFPRIRTYRAMLELVLRNLISNAVHHHDRRQGRIEITGSIEQGHWQFGVGDDGPGISGDAQDQVFKPFVRGNNAGGGPTGHGGDGIGLAQVKRAVTVNGGTIQLISRPEVRRGTTFVVSWPSLPNEVPAA